MNKIRLKLVKIIIATDVLSRGIDLESVDLVINYSDPYNPENYYHRIGRTARYGKFGVSFLLMNEQKKSEWLRESQNFSQKNVKNGKILDQGFQPNGFSSYLWKFENWDEGFLSEINSKLTIKKQEIQVENDAKKSDNIEKVQLGSWIDSEIEHLNSENFKYQQKNQENLIITHALSSPEKIVISEEPEVFNQTKSIMHENLDTEWISDADFDMISNKKFEYEMLMLEIERMEKEERDLLGLNKGEQLSALHYDEQIDEENLIVIGKREIETMKYFTEDEGVTKKHKIEYVESKADFDSFRRLFMLMEDQFLVENMERIEYLREGYSQNKRTIFLSLVTDHLS